LTNVHANRDYSAAPSRASNLLPKILVIDDELGTDETLRTAFCKALLLWNAKSGVAPSGSEIAEVHFESGIRAVAGGSLAFDWAAVSKAILKGWSRQRSWRWALVCIDLNFNLGSTQGLLPHGLDILAQLRGKDPAARLFEDLPIAMLSSESPDEVRILARARLGVDLASVSMRYLKKWVRGHPNDDRQRELRETIFEYGLVEDVDVPTFFDFPIQSKLVRDRVRGSSIELLNSLRSIRSTIASDRNGDFAVVGERGSELDAVAEYICAHRWLAHKHFENKEPRYNPQFKYRNPNDKEDRLSGPAPSGWIVRSAEGLDDERWRAVLARLTDLRRDRRAAMPSSPAFPPALVFTLVSDGSPETDRKLAQLKELQLNIMNWLPLRERLDDCVEIFEGYTSGTPLSEDAAALVSTHLWPGNDAQIERVARRCASAARGLEEIDGDHVRRAIREVADEAASTTISDVESLCRAMSSYRFTKNGELEKAWDLLSKAVLQMFGHLVEDASSNLARDQRLSRAAVSRLLKVKGNSRSNPSQDLLQWAERLDTAFESDSATLGNIAAQITREPPDRPRKSKGPTR
jgi:hypothetical protein